LWVGLVAVGCGVLAVRTLPLTAQGAAWQLSARWPVPGTSFVEQDYDLLAMSYDPGGRLLVLSRPLINGASTEIVTYGQRGEILDRWTVAPATELGVEPVGLAVPFAPALVLMGNAARDNLLTYDLLGQRGPVWQPGGRVPAQAEVCGVAAGGGFNYMATRTAMAGGSDTFAAVWDDTGAARPRFRVLFGIYARGTPCTGTGNSGLNLAADDFGRLYLHRPGFTVRRFRPDGTWDGRLADGVWSEDFAVTTLAARPGHDEIYLFDRNTGRVTVRDTEARIRRQLPAPTDPISSTRHGDAAPTRWQLAVAADGGYALGSDLGLFVYDPLGQQIWTGLRQDARLPKGRLDVGPDDHTWVQYDGELSELDAGGQVLRRRQSETVLDLAAVPGGVVVHTPALLTRYATDGSVVWRVARQSDPYAHVAAVADQLYASLPISRSFELLDLGSGNTVAGAKPLKRDDDWPLALAASPVRLVTDDLRRRGVAIWEPTTPPRLVRWVSFPPGLYVRDVAVGPDGLVAAISTLQVRLFDKSGAALATWTAGTTLTDVSFTPDGRLAVFDSAGPEVRIYAAPGTGPAVPTASPLPTRPAPSTSPPPTGTPPPTAATAVDTPSPTAAASATPRPAPPLCLPWLGTG
jgi:hypothetical protein